MKWGITTFICLLPGLLLLASSARAAEQCVQPAPLDCSVHWAIKYLAPHTIYYSDKFAKPCVQHDYCYRHGQKTYGLTRLQCDSKFYDGMKSQCAKMSWWDYLTGRKPACYAASTEFYNAVRQFGESSYKGTSSSTCCSYSGPATTVACGAAPAPAPTPAPAPAPEPRQCASGQKCCEPALNNGCYLCVPSGALCP